MARVDLPPVDAGPDTTQQRGGSPSLPSSRRLPTLASDAPEGGSPGGRASRRRLRWLAGVSVVLLVAGGLAYWRLANHGPAALTAADVDKAVQNGLKKAQQEARNAAPDAALAYRTILPSLVTVTATPAGASPGASTSASTGASPPSTSSGDVELGAGVVIDDQADVLTALHVVAGSSQIRVRFADGTQATAIVKQAKADTDVAVLTVDRQPQVVVPAVMGGGLRVGDPVFPVGNPLGLIGSLSAGVVSALDRPITTKGGQTLQGLIQFDAAVNPGNSGGPLLNRDGQVVGVVTGLANPSGQSYFVGIGFAVPISTAGGVAGGPAK